MIPFAVIAACHDRTHSCWCIQAQLACHDISSQWTLRQAINKADELQTAAALIPELLMDCILIVSANTRTTFYATVEARPCTSSSCFFPPRLSKQHGWVRQEVDVRMEKWGGGGGVNCCDYHRWGHGEGEAWQVELSLWNAAVFMVQVYRTLSWINAALMKQKHVRITLCSIECFNTCGFLCRLHLCVSLCCFSQAESGPEELGYHNITVKYYISFLMTAKNRNALTKGSQWWLVCKAKTYCFRHWVRSGSVCGLVLFCFI